MDPTSLEGISFQIILHAGNARSSSIEAIQLAKIGKFEEAMEKIAEADQSFLEAHHAQTSLLEKEANGESPSLSILLVHAQDHLMTAMTVKEMAQEFIDLYRKFGPLGK
ncbi:PTS lactose/cellobiose transporter subunit IIA [Bacillus litorisediminis]|uniref:PTS lactose/cellobiose transporter subunit IIA n=1 Tax=Bacillus litorisediminis TaxID=2922713 RepID=UPI001FAF4D49|nr:PTS lactose/cellobiose transporter subunit IIA [Bacillus litorisediminis]